MYMVQYRDKVVDDPFPMYEEYLELIEADGESEEIWLDMVVFDQYPSRYFKAVDTVSECEIQLDITDYISKKTFEMFSDCIYNIDETETFSYTKANSFLMACVEQNKRKGLR